MHRVVLVVSMVVALAAGSAAAQELNQFNSGLEGWQPWNNVHPGEPHSYQLRWNTWDGSFRPPSATVSGDFDVLAVSPMHAHAFGMTRTFTASGARATLAFQYRATSGYPGSTVTNLYVEFLDAEGRTLRLTTVRAGGTTDTGWTRFEVAPVELNGSPTLTLRFFLVDAWTANWSQTISVDDVQLGFEGAPPDELPPTVRLDPLPQYWRDPSLEISGAAIDDGGIAQVDVLVNGGAPTPVAVGSDGAVRASIALSEGLNQIVLRATDRAENVAAATAEVIRDSTPPMITLQSPRPDQAFGSTRVSVRAHIEDATPVTGEVGGRAFALGGPGDVAAEVELAAEGQNTIVLTARDAAGNAASASVDVLLDLSAPLLSSELQDGLAVGPIANGLLPFTLRVDDLGATQVAFSFGDTFALPRGGGVVQTAVPLSEGRNAFSVQVTDELGHVSVLERMVVYDVTGPQGSFLFPTAGAAVRGVIELAAEATDNLTGVSSISFAIDSGAPVTASTAGSGVWTLEVSTAELADGPHAATLFLVDGVGNRSQVEVSFVVDNTAPTVSLSAPVAGAYVRQQMRVIAQAADATSGVARIGLAVNGQAIGTCTAAETCEAIFDTATLPNGVFEVTATAIDEAGNAAAPVQVKAIADNTAPERFLVSPSPGSTLTTSLAVEVNVLDENFYRVECFLDGVSLGASSSATFRTEVSLLDQLDGAHEVECVAEDLAGNVGRERAAIVIDNWTETITPRAMSLKGGGNGTVTVHLEGINVGILLPLSSRALALVVPGGSPVPVRNQAATVEDTDGDGVGQLDLKFDRDALVASIKAGIAVKAIDPAQPVVVRLLSAGREIGRDTIVVK